MTDDRPIGVFDSGVGGLTVAKEIIQALPNESIVYFGDSLRMPYGERDADDLEQLSRRIITFLMSKNIKALVVACGSISAKIFERVKRQVPPDFPIFEMVSPAISAALDATKNGKIGVLATAGTVASGTHEKLLKNVLPNAEITAVAAPLFAPLIEEGWVDNEVARLTAQIYLKPFENSGIDTLLLACTHFPLMHGAIAAALPTNVKIIDPSKRLAADARKVLYFDDNATPPPEHQFFVTAKKEKFDKIAEMVLGFGVDSQLTSI